MRGCALCLAKSGSRTGCCRGRESMMLRGCSALTPRLIRGRRILVTTRGKACPVLNVMGNTLPPLLIEFRAPLLQLRDDTFNAVGLFNRAHADLRGLMCGDG